MLFSQLPPTYAPIGQPLLCTLSQITAPSVEVQIHLAPHGLIGTKRFVNQSSVTFDIAPYLAHRALIDIPHGATAAEFRIDRLLEVKLCAVTANETVETAPMMLRPARRSESAPTLLTTLPAVRLLAEDESDELSFLAPDSQILQVRVIHRDESETTTTQLVRGSGICCYRLVAADYPDADCIVVEGSATDRVQYTLTPPLEGSCRLAWLSSRGSIEHYTFPTTKCIEHEVDKSRAYGADGFCAPRSEREERLVLQSAFETESMMQGICELLDSEQVWRVNKGLYERVDIVTESAKINTLSGFSTLQLTLRPIFKNTSLCN